MKRAFAVSLVLVLLVSVLAVALFADLAVANPMLLPIIVEVESPQNTTYYQTPNPVIFTYYPKYSWCSVKSLPNYHYYQLDGQERMAFSPSFNGSAYCTTLYGLSDGDHSLTIIVTAWEEGELIYYKGVSPTVTFTVDTTPPKVSVLTPQNQTYPSPDVPLNFTVNKPASWLGYSLDGRQPSPCLRTRR